MPLTNVNEGGRAVLRTIDAPRSAVSGADWACGTPHVLAAVARRLAPGGEILLATKMKDFSLEEERIRGLAASSRSAERSSQAFFSCVGSSANRSVTSSPEISRTGCCKRSPRHCGKSNSGRTSMSNSKVIGPSSGTSTASKSKSGSPIAVAATE